MQFTTASMQYRALSLIIYFSIISDHLYINDWHSSNRQNTALSAPIHQYDTPI